MDRESRSYHTAQLDEESRSSKAKLFQTQNAKAPGKNRHRVYILRAADDSAESRVGYSVDPDYRLRQHNGELVGGADDTKGVF